MLKASQKHKDIIAKEKNLELIKKQIARGVKNLKLDKIDNEKDNEQSEKMDVVAMIAEE